MASGKKIDFYLVPQKVSESVGTATPSQYKLVYYKAAGQLEESATKEESSSSEKSSVKLDLPLCALAQITYEQCFNYYNWVGAIKIPSVLQCGDKLSTMVG
jgi:hypothetical protein